MGVYQLDLEAHSSDVPAEKIFKAVLLDANNLLPAILPEAFKKIETIKGDGGVGTIYDVTFAEGIEYRTARQQIDVVDPANLTYSYTITEGDILQGAFESIRNDFKVIPEGKGCTVKHTITYNTIGDAKPTEEQIKDAREKSTNIFRAVESYLLANPVAY